MKLRAARNKVVADKKTADRKTEATTVGAGA
jgi:hypothetical protein